MFLDQIGWLPFCTIDSDATTRNRNARRSCSHLSLAVFCSPYSLSYYLFVTTCTPLRLATCMPTDSGQHHHSLSLPMPRTPHFLRAQQTARNPLPWPITQLSIMISMALLRPATCLPPPPRRQDSISTPQPLHLTLGSTNTPFRTTHRTPTPPRRLSDFLPHRK